MEQILNSLIASGPIGILAAGAAYLYWTKDKECEKLREQVFDMFKASLESQHETRESLKDITRLFQDIKR